MADKRAQKSKAQSNQESSLPKALRTWAKEAMEGKHRTVTVERGLAIAAEYVMPEELRVLALAYGEGKSWNAVGIDLGITADDAKAHGLAILRKLGAP